MERYDVIVVGGGPAGASAARAAALSGARVLLLERSPNRPPRCTGLVGPTIVKLLGLPGQLVLRTIRAVRVYSPSGQAVEFRAETAKGHVLDRSLFDRWLQEQAGEAGAEIRLGVAALGLMGETLCTTAGPARFSVLVGADGAASAVRRWAGLPSPREVLVGVQAVVRAPFPEDMVEVHCGTGLAPGFFAWVVPAEEGQVRAGLATVAGRGAPALLSRFLALRFPESKVLSRTAGLIPIGPPPRTVSGSVVLVGDAAGQVKPLSGGGILFGVLSARIAGEIAARGPSALPSYEAKWRKEVGSEIAFGLRARRVFLSLADPDLDRLVLALDWPALRRLAAQEGDIDRPSELARAALARTELWPAVARLLRAVGGWSPVQDLSLGLPGFRRPG